VIRRTGCALLGAFLLLGCALHPPSGALPDAPPLAAVDAFDLQRYLGRWYEIAKYPNWFEAGLVAVTADYELGGDGEIRVLNAGRKGSFDGPVDSAEAHAWVPDDAAPAKLRVQFFWPFSADYWVIALDPDYRWAVVGEPDRSFLWILSRTPTLPEATYQAILGRIEELGYDSSLLEPTPQPAN
jgi:apolipoprotein D and lipocalin family protein